MALAGSFKSLSNYNNATPMALAGIFKNLQNYNVQQPYGRGKGRLLWLDSKRLLEKLEQQETLFRRDVRIAQGTRMRGSRAAATHDIEEKGWRSPYREWTDFGNKSGGHGGDRIERESPQSQRPAPIGREHRDVDKRLRYGRQGNEANLWEKSSRRPGRRQSGSYGGDNGRQNWTRLKNSEGSRHDRNTVGDARQSTGWEEQEERGSDERVHFGNDYKWQSKEYSPPLVVEGQAVYGVAPILSALQASRREFYFLYMQENLLENIDKGKRKDKKAVSFIEKTAKSIGVTVKVASKHDLNMLVENRPHQGLVLDASPLEMVPVDMLEPPLYQENKFPVWVALDEITDPQNFGAILRSAYFLGADGVVVCAKNSAPLSGVVSKASAGALEVMEVQYCKNMMKFLDKSRENGWRVVGASAQPSALPLKELKPGFATILVLGNEGRGMRTNVKRACDHLVSIAGISSNELGTKNYITSDFATEEEDRFNQEEEEGFDQEEEEGIRRGAEVGFISGPLAVDSLNVSVAAGIMLYELLGRNSTQKDVVAPTGAPLMLTSSWSFSKSIPTALRISPFCYALRVIQSSLCSFTDIRVVTVHRGWRLYKCLPPLRF